MKIAFIYPEYEALGVEMLSAMLKLHGHEVFLVYDPALFNSAMFTSKALSIFFDYKDIIVESLKKIDPDVIAFSVFTDYYLRALSLSKIIKKSISRPVVFGGIHPTMLPEAVISEDSVDFVVKGEGEYAFLELLDAIKKDSFQGPIDAVVYKSKGNIVSGRLRPLIADLDSLPMPDKELFYNTIPYLNNYTIMTGRGCVYRCTYCCNDALKRMYGTNKIVRRRSPENVLNELRIAKDKYKKPIVVFDDEVFTYDLDWLEDFAAGYKKDIGLPSFCWTHPNTINDRSVRLLKDINCNETEIGVQTLNESIRRTVLNRYYSNERLEKGLRLLKQNDIAITVDSICGLPNETQDDYAALLKFYNDIRPDKIFIYFLKYYPNTEIIKRSNLTKERIDQINLEPKRQSFLSGGDSPTKEQLKLQFVVTCIYILPKRLVDFLISRKLYRFFPSINIIFVNIVLCHFKLYLRRKWVRISVNLPVLYAKYMSIVIGRKISRFIGIKAKT